jgi:hypothetical protein
MHELLEELEKWRGEVKGLHISSSAFVSLVLVCTVIGLQPGLRTTANVCYRAGYPQQQLEFVIYKPREILLDHFELRPRPYVHYTVHCKRATTG